MIQHCSMSSLDMMNEIIRLCYAEGLHPDEDKLRKRLGRASTLEIERLLDAFYRFGVRTILTNCWGE